MTTPFSGIGIAADDEPARYVQRGGEVVWRHPITFEGVRLHGFVVEAHAANLARLLYRTFTEPSDGEVEVEPLGNWVLLAFMETETIRPSEAPDDRLGEASEAEAAIWVPVHDKVHNRRYWTLPYMFVAQSAATAAGRESYGFPKQSGTITVDGTDPPRSLCARVPTIGRFGRGIGVAEEDVITVARPTFGHPPAVQWADVSTVHRELIADSATAGRATTGGGRLESLVATGLSAVQGSSRAFADAPQVAALLLEGFLQGRLPLLLLKQFRSCEDPAVACYQSIVHVDLTIAESRGVALLPDDYTVDIADLDGEPLIADLGLAATSQPRVGFTMNFDFDVQRGSVVWSTSRPGR